MLVIIISSVIFVGLLLILAMMNMMRILFFIAYRVLSMRYWPVRSQFPGVMNIAFPDESARYYVMSFPSGVFVEVSGDRHVDSVFYWSITLYDTTGTPIAWVNDSMFSNDKYRIRHWCDRTCCMVVRYYVRDQKARPRLPTVSVPGRQLEPTSGSVVDRNCSRIQSLIYTVSPWRRYDFCGQDTSRFFLGNPAKMQSLFPNPDAMYLMCLPDDKSIVMIITLRVDKDARFVGFMAGDLRTTRTVSSTSALPPGEWCTIYVSTSAEQAERHGFDREVHRLLLWDDDTKWPILIYRQIDTDGNDTEGIRRFRDATRHVDAETIQEEMGDTYPVIRPTIE